MALPNDYAGQACSLARTLEVVGERWTLLIVRDAFFGVRRFDDWQARLGVARNVLAARLKALVEQGVMETRLYSEHPPRKDYVLTRKGRDLLPVILTLKAWGDQHVYGAAGRPLAERDISDYLARWQRPLAAFVLGACRGERWAPQAHGWRCAGRHRACGGAARDGRILGARRGAAGERTDRLRLGRP